MTTELTPKCKTQTEADQAINAAEPLNTSVIDDGWHTFGMWCTPTVTKVYVDGVLDRTFTTVGG